MSRHLLTAALLCTGFAAAQPAIVSTHAKADLPLTADPNSPQWKSAPGVFTENDALGAVVPGHKTEIRSRWTKDNLYILFICPYRELYSKPDPVTNADTNKLWEWDVAEAFIGSDFQNIDRYKEFELSPHGEWVDLDIDRKSPKTQGGIKWNSEFKTKARIDEQNKAWYGEMVIPFKSIAEKAPAAGQEFRVNFYRMQGPPPTRLKIAWQPTHAPSYHVPSAFGIMKLAK